MYFKRCDTRNVHDVKCVLYVNNVAFVTTDSGTDWLHQNPSRPLGISVDDPMEINRGKPQRSKQIDRDKKARCETHPRGGKIMGTNRPGPSYSKLGYSLYASFMVASTT